MKLNKKIFIISIFLGFLLILILFICMKCSHLSQSEYSETISPIELSKIPNPITLEEFQRINSDSQEIIYDVETNIPKEIRGKTLSPKIKNEKDALYALLEVRDIMGIEDIEFYCVDTELDFDESNSIRLGQLYDGIPVEDGIFLVYYDELQNVCAIKGEYQNNINVDTKDYLNSTQASQSLKIPLSSNVEEASLMIVNVSTERRYALAWRFGIVPDISRGNIIEQYIYVDAHSGEVLNQSQINVTETLVYTYSKI